MLTRSLNSLGSTCQTFGCCSIVGVLYSMTVSLSLTILIGVGSRLLVEYQYLSLMLDVYKVLLCFFDGLTLPQDLLFLMCPCVLAIRSNGIYDVTFFEQHHRLL